MTRKTYFGTLIDVSFDGERCQHAAECVRGMPSVFDTSARPWIAPGQAAEAGSRDLLIEVIGRCPSGALRYEIRQSPGPRVSVEGDQVHQRLGRSGGPADVGT